MVKELYLFIGEILILLSISISISNFGFSIEIDVYLIGFEVVVVRDEIFFNVVLSKGVLSLS